VIEFSWNASCPAPRHDAKRISLAHGGGGRRTQQLLEDIFRPAFGNPLLDAQHDGAVFTPLAKRIAVTTDAYVVQPIFFPGGNIGSLAINGAVNDLAMCGAIPRYLTASFILEEGLPVESLRQVVDTMRQAAAAAGVKIVAGDTKVVERGKADGMYLSVTGVGEVDHDLIIQPSNVQVGDAIVLSGDLGRHGIAVQASRAGLEFQGALPSDCAPLIEPVAALIDSGIDVRCLRDLTRGGLAAALVEIATKSGLTTEINETLIPLEESVRGACELFGLDPLLVACEGRFVAYVPNNQADRAEAILRKFPVSADARRIGHVTPPNVSPVIMVTALGSQRVIDLPSGEQLPRIC
jgi:hydrogenase expression/formation protein HypE